jgi:putative tricarboxylic transport membrane protein
MVKSNAGVWAGVFLLAFSIFILTQSLAYDYEGPMGPGPGLLPLWLSGILLVFSILYITESLRHVISFRDILPDNKGMRNILIILGSFVIYLVIVPFVGFIISSTMFLFLLLRREYKWYVGAGISIGVSVILFWLFSTLLSVPLPVNDLGF